MAIVTVTDSSRNKIVLNRSTAKSVVKVVLLDISRIPIKNTEISISDATGKIADGKTKEDGAFLFEYDGNADELKIAFPLLKFIPDFNSLWKNHLRDKDYETIAARNGTTPAEEIKKEIGGKVNADWISNTCAIRMSRSFNLSGFAIPKIQTLQPDGKPRWETVTGIDGKWHILRVETFLSHILQKEYGKPDIESTLPTAFSGTKGIMLFKVSTWTDATGHLDLWDGSKISNHEHFSQSDYVQLWAAKKIELINKENHNDKSIFTFQIKKL